MSLTIGQSYKFQNLSDAAAGGTGNFLHHNGVDSPVGLAGAGTADELRAASFRVVAGLDGVAGHFSLEAVSQAGWYLTLGGEAGAQYPLANQIVLRRVDGSSDATLKQAATFRENTGCADTTYVGIIAVYAQPGRCAWLVRAGEQLMTGDPGAPDYMGQAFWRQTGIYGAPRKAVQEFSSTTNPNGPWTYGWRPATKEQTPGKSAEFNANTIRYNYNGGDYWKPTNEMAPAVMKNGTAGSYWYYEQWVPAGVMMLHPGKQGQFSVLRYTAGVAGLHALDVTFSECVPTQSGGRTTTSSVYVLRGDAVLAAANLNSASCGGSYSFRTEITLAQNETVDFAVGYGGGGGTWDKDATGIDVVISPPA